MGKINKQILKVRFHICPIFCFRLHIYYIGIEDYDFGNKNVKKRNFKKIKKSNLAF
jgi:hypothetical protein